MKKVILSLAFLFSIVIIGTAQTSSDSVKFHWGVRAGAGFGKIGGTSSATESFNTKMKAGGYIGVFGEYEFSSLLGIQPEVSFRTMNVQTVGTPVANLTDGQKRTLNYVDIPVLLKLKVSPTFSIMAGPQYSILLNNPDGVGYTWYDNGKAGQKTLKSGDFSVVGGAQLTFGRVRIQARYVAGLSNVANYAAQSYATPNQSWKTSQIQIGLAYAIF